MKHIDLGEVTALQPFLQSGSTEPMLVTTNGQPVAAVVPVAGADDLEDLLLSRSPQMDAVLERSERRLEAEGSLSSDEVRRRLGLT